MKPGSPPELFVVGSGRSGTTVVLAGISCAPGVMAIPRLAGRVAWATGMAARMTRHQVGPSSWRRPSPESTAIFSEAGLTQDLQVSLRRSVSKCDESTLHMERMAQRFNSIRVHGNVGTVVVKNTAACARVPILATTFPRAAFVHVLRHPGWVIDSLLQTRFWTDMTLWWDGRTVAEYAHANKMSLETVAARHWSKQVTSLSRDLGDLAESRSLIIRYEKFVQDSATQLARLNRVGLSFEDSTWTERLAHLDIHPLQQGRLLSREIQRSIDNECAGTASSLGIVL